MGIRNKDRQHKWTKREDNYIRQAVRAGKTYSAIGKFLCLSRKVCFNRHIRLAETDQAAEEARNPQAEKALNYLRSRDYIAYAKNGLYIVNRDEYSYSGLLYKAHTVEQNTKLIYGG